MRKKLIVEKLDNLIPVQIEKIALFTFHDDILKDINFVYNESLIGNIYVGRVKDIVNNINAAFVEFDDKKTGYYSLFDNKKHIFLNDKKNDTLVQGDKILVQVSADAIKTKAYTLTSKISLTGRKCVFINASSGIGFSKKIQDETFKKEVHDAIKPPFGSYIIRTEAVNYSIKEISDEAAELIKKFNHLIETAHHSPFYTMIYGEKNGIKKAFSTLNEDEYDEIIVEDKELFNMINMELDIPSEKIILYSDKLLKMKKLYSLERHINDAISKKVWLKSGAYLIIEPTEAMTVVDVNTGKNVNKINQQDTYLKINLEACDEISRQLAIRNISGIIIVDFINMKSEEHRIKLLDYLSEVLLKSKVKTKVCGMTKLGLVEITRKKIKKSIYEEIETTSFIGS